MATYPHTINLNNGVSAHDVLVGLGLEAADHAAGQLCHLVALSANTIAFDDATVFDTPQPAGQIAPGKQTLLAIGLWRGSPDIALLRQYAGLAAGQATLGQTQAALQAFLRVVKQIVT